MHQSLIPRFHLILAVPTLVMAAIILVGCQSDAGETPNGLAPSALRATPDHPPTTVPSVVAQSSLPDPTATFAPTRPREDVTPSAAASATVTVAASAAVTVAVSPVVTATADQEPTYGYRVVNAFPHDPAAFTEGLVYVDGILYEGTGLDSESNPPGRSVLEKKILETGEVLQGVALAPQYFGEGVTVFADQVFQLTWQERTGFVYDKETLETLRTFAISSDGWGLTHDGERLIRSDGTNSLIFIDPVSLEETGRVAVRDRRGMPVVNLNELEYVDGEIYANVWLTDRIARIDPTTGEVLGWIDLAGLLPPEDRAQRVDVLNGIAYDADQDRLFVTGKWWPKLFEIDVVAHGD